MFQAHGIGICHRQPHKTAPPQARPAQRGHELQSKKLTRPGRKAQKTRPREAAEERGKNPKLLAMARGDRQRCGGIFAAGLRGCRGCRCVCRRGERSRPLLLSEDVGDAGATANAVDRARVRGLAALMGDFALNSCRFLACSSNS
mmetsp:Transcript_5855/g.14245  ORF Transcript_5855/g.14245 Transcript_5855/m.14245 type:complete len:145 (+) Transcript_5855:26-460(+)